MARKNINWNEQPLATVPCSILAKRLGVTLSAVTQARQKRGIANPDLKEYEKGLRQQALTRAGKQVQTQGPRRRCMACGMEFIPEYTGQSCCSRECRSEVVA